MEQLVVQGVSDDGTAVVLVGPSGSGLGPFAVPRDGRLRAAALGQRLEAAGPSGSGTGSLPPREIQARLRAGAAPAEIAASAGIAVEKVLRYAGPVEAERARVVTDARAATLAGTADRPRAVALADVVDPQLAGASAWNSWRREDGSWTVELDHDGGRAQWRWDALRRRVEPLDDAARRLVYGERAAAAEPAHTAEPAGPVEFAEPEVALPAARTAARARASMPSWDDIVFGTERRSRGPGDG